MVVGEPGGARTEASWTPRYYDDPLAAYLLDGVPARAPYVDVLA